MRRRLSLLLALAGLVPALAFGAAETAKSDKGGYTRAIICVSDDANLEPRQCRADATTNAILVETAAGSPITLSKAASYTASSNWTPDAAGATDTATIYGSASKTIKIQRVAISAVATGAAALDVFLIKRSTTDSGGTSAAMTVVPHDSASAAGTATPVAYTVNPAGLGTAVGSVAQWRHPVAVTATAGQTAYVWDYRLDGEPIVLRGTSQGLVVNLNATGAAIAGLRVLITFTWTEE